MRKTRLIMACALAALIGGVGFVPARYAVRAAAEEAEVGGVTYATFTEACEHWSDGTMLKLLSDVTLPSELVLGDGATRRLDLNGHTLASGEKSRLLNLSKGTVVISDTVGSGLLKGGKVSASGGVISVTDGATLTVEAGSLTGGNAEKGGGIYVYSSTLNLLGGTVYGNTAGLGGGVYAEDSTVQLKNSTIRDNRASVDGGGLVVWGEAERSTVTLSGCSISGNQAEGNGGGIVLWKDTQCTLSGSTEVSANHAKIGGGGIYLRGSIPVDETESEAHAAAESSAVYCTLDMTGGDIGDNVAESGFGGGIKIASGGVLNLSGGTVTGNSAAMGGGGISVEHNAEANFGGQAAVARNTLAAEEGDAPVNNIFVVNGGSTGLNDDLSANAELGFNMVAYGIISENFGGDPEVIGHAVSADNADYEVMIEGKTVSLGSNIPEAINVSGYKSEYNVGEDFDRTGMLVTVTFLDGRTVAVTDFDIEGGLDLKPTTKYVSVLYTLKNTTVRANIPIRMISANGGAAEQGAAATKSGNLFGFIAVITLSAVFVIALIVVGILTDGFKGKKKKSE